MPLFVLLHMIFIIGNNLKTTIALCTLCNCFFRIYNSS